MTESELDALDVLLAEKVMGWPKKRPKYTADYPCILPTRNSKCCVRKDLATGWSPTRNIANAYDALEATGMDFMIWYRRPPWSDKRTYAVGLASVEMAEGETFCTAACGALKQFAERSDEPRPS